MIKVYCYSRCSTCKKALAWLDAQGYKYDLIDIKTQHPDERTLRSLHKNPSNEMTPCHRVVNAKGFCSGSFAFGGPDAQRSKLEAEGVCFVDGHVDLERHLINEDDFEAMKAGLP